MWAQTLPVSRGRAPFSRHLSRLGSRLAESGSRRHSDITFWFSDVEYNVACPIHSLTSKWMFKDPQRCGLVFPMLRGEI